MEIKRFVGGELRNNGYIVYDAQGGECAIIDPGFQPELFIRFINEKDLKTKYILLTHHHYDHVGGVETIKHATGCAVAMHNKDMKNYGKPVDISLNNGDLIEFGSIKLKVISTPGHTAGSICFSTIDEKHIFTGDTLFDREIGRTDLPSGSATAMEMTMKSIVDSWQDDTCIYPGHTDPCDMKFVRSANEEFRYALKLSGTIKMIALDLDHTTLNQEGDLSSDNALAITKALQSGVHTVIATGRCFAALPDSIRRFEGIRYAITSNGANVLDLTSGKTLYHNLISSAAITSVCDILKKYDFDIEVFVNGRAYIDRKAYEKTLKLNLHGRRKYVMATRDPVDDIYAFMLDNKCEIENINVIFDNDADNKELRGIVEKIPDITITSSLPYNLEIGGESTSKADALEHLCETLAVAPGAVMACGDGLNDISMLKTAGLAVAVANAVPAVKEHAQFTVSSSENAGVAEAIGKFVLAKN